MTFAPYEQSHILVYPVGHRSGLYGEEGPKQPPPTVMKLANILTKSLLCIYD